MKKPTCLKNSLKDFKRIFEEAITVKFIAELDLCKFNANDLAEEVKKQMENKSFDCAPIVEKDGSIIRYVKLGNIEDKQGLCGEHAKEITSDEKISADSPLLDILDKFKNNDFCFVICNNKINGIVTKADLQKTIVRLYVFGVLTILEQQLRDEIQKQYPNDKWLDFVSNKKSIENNYKKKKANNIEINKISCTTLFDIVEILKKDEKILKCLNCPTKDLDKIKKLRNDIAHVQKDIFSDNCCKTFFEIINKIENILICENNRK